MRTNLILHFYCSECGNRLNIKTNGDEKVENDNGFGNGFNESPKEPTGAECRYVPDIQIDPCVYCIEKYTRPAKALVDALSELK
jgi:hypothetical protein